MLTIELSLPPSVNSKSLVSRRLGNEAPEVKAWRRLADLDLREQGIYGDRLRAAAIHGPWAADIIWTSREQRHSDLDNRVKYLLDYIRSRELVEDDVMCDHISIDWGMAPRGCRVRLYQWEVPVMSDPTT